MTSVTPAAERSREPRSGTASTRARWVWLALVALLALYVFSAWRTDPVATFGVFLDDALYFSSAKALATNGSFTLPSFPAHLPAMKFPKLYPYLLSVVWRLNPHFPRNVSLAVALTLLFGCIFLVAAFQMLREWRGMSSWPALAVVALCGLSSFFLYMSACVMSDVPFIALALTGVWLGQRSLSSPRGRSAAATALAAGLFVGLSVGFRSLGVTVAAGVGLWMILKRRFRPLIWFCVTGLPLTLAWSWQAVTGFLGNGGTAFYISHPTQSGWTQTLCYYTSYGCDLRMSVSGLSSVLAILKVNLLVVALQPGLYLLDPVAAQGTPVGLVLLGLTSAFAYAGIVRQWRRTGWEAIHAVFCCYVFTAVVFPYNLDRYLLLFVPLFFGGMWVEGQRLRSLLAGRLGGGHPASELIVATVLAGAALCIGAIVLVNLTYSVPNKLHRLDAQHGRVLASERGAFEWLRRHAPADASILASEDGLTYLSTGRASIMPLMVLPQSFFQHDSRFATQDAARLPDVAKHVGASYWLTSPYDFSLEDPGGFGIVPERQNSLLLHAPVVYRSRDGTVAIYDVRCFTRSSRAGCPQPSAVWTRVVPLSYSRKVGIGKGRD